MYQAKAGYSIKQEIRLGPWAQEFSAVNTLRKQTLGYLGEEHSREKPAEKQK